MSIHKNNREFVKTDLVTFYFALVPSINADWWFWVLWMCSFVKFILRTHPFIKFIFKAHHGGSQVAREKHNMEYFLPINMFYTSTIWNSKQKISLLEFLFCSNTITTILSTKISYFNKHIKIMIPVVIKETN